MLIEAKAGTDKVRVTLSLTTAACNRTPTPTPTPTPVSPLPTPTAKPTLPAFVPTVVAYTRFGLYSGIDHAHNKTEPEPNLAECTYRLYPDPNAIRLWTTFLPWLSK